MACAKTLFLTAALVAFAATALNAQEATNFPESALATLPDASSVLQANKAIAEALSKESAANTEIVTNFGSNALLRDELRVVPTHARLWDVNLIFYTKAFAEKQGLPPNLVMDLPENVTALGYTQTTLGRSLRCGLNLLLNGALGLAVPTEDHSSPIIYNRFFYPRVLQKPATHEFPNNIDEHWPVPTDFAFATTDLHWEGNKVKGHTGVLGVTHYKHDYFKGLDYFSFQIDCGRFSQSVLASGKASIWIKKSGNADYSQRMKIDSDDFYKVPLPQSLSDVALTLMREGYAYIDAQSPKVEIKKDK